MFGLGKKKSKDASIQNETAVQVTEKTTAKAPKQKKKKDGMWSILKESVVESMVAICAKNSEFVVMRDGEEMYAALLLDTADIGGLNKKAAKDEAKGSIVEQINSGLISVLITDKLLMDEKLVIIPNAITMSVIDEYTLLTEAPYTLVYVHKDGGVELTGRRVTYKEASEVLNEVRTLEEFTGEMAVSESEPEDGLIAEESEEYVDEADTVDDYDSVEDDVYEEEPVYEDDPEEEFYVPDEDASAFDDSEDAFGDDGAFSEDDDDLYAEDQNDEVVLSEGTEDYEEDIEEEESVPEELVHKAMMRKFYSDDLGIEVTTEPFDVQFLNNNTYFGFNEDRGEGWLNEQLSQLSKEMNLDLQKQHQENLFELREFYFQAVSEHAESIQKSLDISNTDTEFGQKYQNLLSQKAHAASDIDSEVVKRRTALEKEWNMKLQQAGEDAARAAQQQYRERYGRQHEDDLFRLENGVRDDIEHDFADAVRELQTHRREDASRRMDYGITAILKEVAELYKQKVVEERERYDACQEHLLTYLDENRKDEVVRIQVLQEELAQKEKADLVMHEMTEKMNAMTSEFEAKRASLQSDIDKMRSRHEQVLKTKDEDWKAKLDDANFRNKELQDRIDKIMAMYADLDKTKKMEYEGRVNELQNQVKTLTDREVHMESVYKRNGRVSSFMVVTLVAATLAIGFIGGQFVRINYDTKDTSEQIRQQIEQEYDRQYQMQYQQNQQPQTNQQNQLQQNADTQQVQDSANSVPKDTSAVQ